jgi:Holliday junction resolvase RusA-like endonuclease
MLHLTVLGDPIPQARPRLTKGGGVYNPQYKQLAEAKRCIANQVSKIKGFETHTQAILVAMIFYIKIPKTVQHEEGEYHTGKGDVDNFSKFYMDAMNGIVYRDDAIVSKLLCAKVYSTQPRTEIMIKQLGRKHD